MTDALAPRNGGVNDTVTVKRAALFDVDGTLVDSMPNLRQVWAAWADRHGLDHERVWDCAARTRPLDTFAELVPGDDPATCLAVLHQLEDEDARDGRYHAFAGAQALLGELPPNRWALVTSNYAHRVRIRFDRLRLPLPDVLVDAASVERGKPHPQGYLMAAERLERSPAECLVVEDSPAGVHAGVAAGMTVWVVNEAAQVSGAHRCYATLEAARPDIRAWVRGQDPPATPVRSETATT